LQDDALSLSCDVTHLSSDDRIDVVCDAFEGAWLSGSRPNISAHLAHGRSDERRALFKELVLLDIDYLRSSGQAPGADYYASQYPEFAEVVEEAMLVYEGAGFVSTHNPRKPGRP
jgi:hypothetical protein